MHLRLRARSAGGALVAMVASQSVGVEPIAVDIRNSSPPRLKEQRALL
jgi:hypothetical protein